MPPIPKPSQQQPIKCKKCNTSGTIKGSLGDVVCPDCLMVGYTNPDGTPLDDNDAVRLLKKAENYYKHRYQELENRLRKAEERQQASDATIARIRSLVAYDPGVYRDDGKGQVYHGD